MKVPDVSFADYKTKQRGPSGGGEVLYDTSYIIILSSNKRLRAE